MIETTLWNEEKKNWEAVEVLTSDVRYRRYQRSFSQFRRFDEKY